MSGGSYGPKDPKRSGMLSFLDETNTPPVPRPARSTLQMSGAPVSMSAWELREEVELEDADAKDVAGEDLEDMQGDVFSEIHKGTHPDVKEYLMKRNASFQMPPAAGSVKHLVSLFEAGGMKQVASFQPDVASSSKATYSNPGSLKAAINASAAPAALTAENMVSVLSVSVSAVEDVPLPAAMASDLALAASPVQQAGSHNRRSVRPTGQGFYEHRQMENARVQNLVPPEITKIAASTAAEPVDEPQAASRYPSREAGPGYYEYQQTENDRLNKKRPRSGGGGRG